MEAGLAIKAVAALLLVLGLIGLMALALRRLPGGLTLPGARARRGGEVRVLEMCRLGLRHQLVRVAYGGSEHLLLLGPAGDTLVASRPAPTAGGTEGEGT